MLQPLSSPVRIPGQSYLFGISPLQSAALTMPPRAAKMCSPQRIGILFDFHRSAKPLVARRTRSTRTATFGLSTPGGAPPPPPVDSTVLTPSELGFLTAEARGDTGHVAPNISLNSQATRRPLRSKVYLPAPSALSCCTSLRGAAG